MSDAVAVDRRPLWDHVIPFAAWLAIMALLGEPAGWKYAVRAAAGLALFLYLRPWRWNYPPLNPRNLLSAAAVGVAVFGIWIFPQTDWFARFETLHRAYLTFGMQMPWQLSPPLEQIRYAPDLEGWGFALIRLAGSAFVIAIVEEFFWRGCAYRWIQKEDFLSVDPGEFDVRAFWITAALFASIHNEWLVGLICGVIYGLYYIRTRDIWAVSLAHMITNLLLGIYVLWSGKYEFWA